MLTFELSAIDLILAVSVVILMVLYLTKIDPQYQEQASLLKQIKKNTKQKNLKVQIKSNYAECPRGFGNIKRISEDNSISDRCLGCYRIMDCYEKNDCRTEQSDVIQ
jgi:hypothetical protein